MTAIATPTSVTTVPVAALVPSPLNPRKSFDATKLTALAESIAAQGVLQNLVVRQLGNVYEIAAGERRYRAVMALVEAGRLEPTSELPVVVRDLTDRELLQIAMSENVKRADMHPLEEADGYLKMVELGETADSIATAVGVAISSVQKRLKIAENLCDRGRNLLFSGSITLAQAQALSIASKVDQDAYLQNPHYGGFPSPSSIKAVLTNRRPPVSRAFFKLETYTGRGGVIVQDLFADQEDDSARHFADFELFLTLQNEAIQTKKQELEKKGQTVHILEQSYFPWSEYDARKKHTVIRLDPNTYEVEVRRDFGPIERTSARSGSGSIDGTAKPPQKNKKRLAFEDQALTRAAQHAVHDSERLAKIVVIAGAFGASGLRFWKNDCPARYETAYQDETLKAQLDGLRKAVREPLGVTQFETQNGGDLLDFPTSARWQGGRAGKLYSYLNDLPDDDLDLLFRAVAAAHVATVFEGEGHATATFLLEQSAPDMHEFFTADEAYLSACKKDELAAIAPELKVGFDASAKKADTVKQLASRSELKDWLPERLRLEKKDK